MRWTTAALCAMALALASCGGSGDDAARTATAAVGTTSVQSTTTGESSEDSSSIREVNARVGGRRLNGHCRGTQGAAPAVMLEVGMAVDADQNQLVMIEEHLEERTVVCAYDRAGVGSSDPSPKTPRSVTDVVEDADAFIAATEVDPPYVLVGFSAGGAIAFMYAQAHPDKVAGFVSMNPVPPATPFLALARKVETEGEFVNELGFYDGSNEEGIVFTATERMLTDALPPTMPYTVLFDEDCGGDSDFCGRILPPLTKVTKMLASVGERGRFVRAKGAGHNIDQTRPELVHKTIDEVLDSAGDR